MRRARSLACALLAGAWLAGLAEPARAAEGDPIEGLNRGIWWFNDKLDRYVLEPAAIGWTWITPGFVRTGFGHAFDNLRFPLRFVNDLLQGDVKQAGRETGRFLMNSTVGIAGFLDPASEYGLGMRPEDFGQTLGRWGLGPGAYVMLPILGPSGVRDGVALPLDLALGAWPGLISPEAATAIGVVDRVNTRAALIDDIRSARESSLDYYVFVRNAYRQLREARVQNGAIPDEESERDLYELEEDDE